MTDYKDLVFNFPARIVGPYEPEDRESLLDVIREYHAFDRDSISADDLFLFPGEISSERVDSYFTRMLESSLRNYAEEATEGVSLQNSHKWRELGFGRSVRGLLEESPEDGALRVRADFYVIPGLKLNGVQSDDVIQGIRTGIVKDLSIGFHGGEYWCDVCGNNLFDYEACPHIPGLSYETEDGDGEVVATAGIEGAHLSEVSTVYDGATPGAAVLKARQEADAGRLKPEHARLLERRYRIRLPSARHTWRGVDLARSPSIPISVDPRSDKRGEEVNPMSKITVEAALDRLRGQFRSEPLDLSTLPDGEEGVQTLIDSLREMTDQVSNARQEVSRLRPLAEMGRQYRADLIDEALKQGVRAYGEDFDKERYQTLLESDACDLETIKRFREDWQSVGDDRLPSGRQTTEETEDGEETGARGGQWIDPAEPVEAYQA